MPTWPRCVYDPVTQNIGFKADYAKDVYVIQYDQKGGTPRVWKLENAWPSVLPGATWDYNNESRRQMQFNLVCDRCIPDYGIDTRTFAAVNNSPDSINSITKTTIKDGMNTKQYGYDVFTNQYIAHNSIGTTTFSNNQPGIYFEDRV